MLPIPPPGYVDLWIVKADPEDTFQLSMLIDAKDIQRCRNLLIEKKQRQFIFSHCTLRHILDIYAGRYDLERSFNGKPSIARADGGRWAFSFSHSEYFCAIALSLTEVGVDIESVSSQVNLYELMRYYFPGCVESMAGLPSEMQKEAGRRAWCRFEAVTKLEGDMLYQQLWNHARVPWYKQPHAFRAIEHTEYDCVVAQHHPFRFSNVRCKTFKEIASEEAAYHY